MTSAIGTALTSMITWLGTIVTAVVGPVVEGSTSGALSELLPGLAIFVAGSLVLFGVKIFRGFTWGA